MSLGATDRGLLILTSLAQGPKHGYALMQDIEAFAGVRLSPGTLYGAITRLEEAGLIEPLEPADRRLPYRMTPAGVKALEDELSEHARITTIGMSRLASTS